MTKCLPFHTICRRASLAAALMMSVLGAPVDAASFVGSWNIRNLGWGDEKDFGSVAQVASRYDLLAVQEVMSEDGLEELRLRTEAMTGVEWHVQKSHLVGRGRYKEIYAFLYRPDRMTWVGGSVTYTDDRDVFEREPFSAVFRSDEGLEFVMSTVHLIYGDDQERRQREAIALDSYRQWLGDSFPGLPVFIVGDFNLPPTDAAWQELGRVAYPLIQDGATTLSPSDGRYANLYDNIWAPVGITLPIAGAGIDRFPQDVLAIDHEHARKTISDHAPVFMVLDRQAAGGTFAPWTNNGDAPLILAAESTIEIELPPAVGNRGSKIYHVDGCPGYRKVSERNREGFENEAAAISAGYRKARNC